MTDKDKILEWCGFTYETKAIHDTSCGKEFEGVDWTKHYWVMGNIRLEEYVQLDLNFYFKYAYPLIPDKDKFRFLLRWITEVDNGEDPAEAFGQALLKLIKEKE